MKKIISQQKIQFQHNFQQTKWKKVYLNLLKEISFSNNLRKVSLFQYSMVYKEMKTL